MIMSCVFCCANFEFNTIKSDTVINIYNKTVDMFFDFVINATNILIRVIERLVK